MAAMADDRVHERFGTNVRIRRLRAGLTQDQLATTIGLSRTSVANIEQGRQQVLLHHAWAIARALGAESIDELVGFEVPSADARKLTLPEGMDPAYADWARVVVGSRHG
jgi:transcriptional regulator with XRE-family HTH domain